MKLGLHLPNYQWKAFTERELASVVELAPSTLLYLLYEQQPDSVRRQQINQVRNLVSTLKATLYVRIYHPEIPKQDPNYWADVCADLLDAWLPEPVHVIPANEMTLPLEGGHSNYGKHRWWLQLFANRFRSLRPFDILHLPAPWPSIDGSKAIEWYDNLGDVVNLYDIVDAHDYAGTRTYMHARKFGKPVAITEFNQYSPLKMAQEIAPLPDVETAIWFLLKGEADMSPYFLLDSPYYELFYRAQREVIPYQPNGVITMPTYQFGIKALADKLGRNVVGDPLTNEIYIGDSYCYQITTKGKFEYYKHCNRVYFYPAMQ